MKKGRKHISKIILLLVKSASLKLPLVGDLLLVHKMMFSIFPFSKTSVSASKPSPVHSLLCENEAGALQITFLFWQCLYIQLS